MKKLLPALLALLIFACQSPSEKAADTAEIKEATVTTSEEEVSTGAFGAEISAASLVTLTDAIGELGEEEMAIKTSGKIESVCQNKGCWMVIKAPDNKEVRVTFKDYGFFVPKNSMGNTAIIEGVLAKKVTTVEELRHYAEDAGKSAEEIAKIVDPEESYSFVAEGVVIEG